MDLVYLDPPFNSNATYNVLFPEKSGKKSAHLGLDSLNTKVYALPCRRLRYEET